MHEHYKIKEAIWPLLEKVGFKIDSENNEIDYCGSIRTIFINNEKRVMLEWDGEEGLGYVEVWENNAWSKLSTNVLESKENEFQQAVEKLCKALQNYI